MGVPTGAIIAKPMVARACGCVCEFQHYAIDKYRAQRLAKFQQSRCADCVNKLNEEQRLAAAAMPKKGEALRLLPTGAQIVMSRRADGSWNGSLTGDGTKVEGFADGTQSLTVMLARQWLAAKGIKSEPDAPAPAPKVEAPTPRPVGSAPPVRTGRP